MSSASSPRPMAAPIEPAAVPSDIRRELREIFVRRACYRYDFADVTNRPAWLARFLGRGFRTDWRPKYESMLADCSGVPHAITFAAGRMALFAILEALDIGPGDEVVIPAYTCVVVPNAVLYRGARPVYVDVGLDDFNIDVDRLDGAITSKTRAIVAQHTFGRACRIDAIREIAAGHGVTVIEDVAHAIGGSTAGRPLGSLGDVAFGSSDHSKIFSTSLGGFALTRSSVLAERIRAVQHRSGIMATSARVRIAFQYAALGVATQPWLHWLTRMPVEQLARVRLWFYFADELLLERPALYPAQLPNFAAFVGYQEVSQLAENIAHRRAVARRYQTILFKDDSPLPDGACLRYSLLVRSPRRWEETLGPYFTIGRWFSSVAHGRTTALERIGYQAGSCPAAEQITRHIVNLPTHAGINERALVRFEKLVHDYSLVDDILPATIPEVR